MNTRNLLVSALVVGLALPAFAQDGFRVGVQVGSMKTTGDATNFSFTTNGSAAEIDQHNFDQPTQSPFALDFAYVKGDDEWSLTYFSTKKSTTKTMMDPVNGVYFGGLIFSTADAGLTGSQERKATIIDLSWKRTLVKGDMGSFAFSSGLRYSKQSDELSYQRLNASGAPDPGTVHIKGEGTGFGLTAGLHGRLNISDRMWVTTGFGAALINNTAKLDDFTTTSMPPFGNAHITSDDSHASLLQTDAYLRYNMNFVSTFNGYLGYEVRDFNRDAAKTQISSFSILGYPTTGGFGLSGFTLGLSYTF